MNWKLKSLVDICFIIVELRCAFFLSQGLGYTVYRGILNQVYGIVPPKLLLLWAQSIPFFQILAFGMNLRGKVLNYNFLFSGKLVYHYRLVETVENVASPAPFRVKQSPEH